MSTEDDTRQKLVELVSDARICMLTTMDEEGNHVARPMGMQEVEFDGDLWFFTESTSRKASQIRKNPNVGVTFSDQKNNSWVSISGSADLVDGKNKAKELWNPFLKAWFPDGVDTPELVLIKVTATGAEYWDSPLSKVVTLLSMAKGAITGKPADPGDNETVSL